MVYGFLQVATPGLSNNSCYTLWARCGAYSDAVYLESLLDYISTCDVSLICDALKKNTYTSYLASIKCVCNP